MPRHFASGVIAPPGFSYPSSIDLARRAKKKSRPTKLPKIPYVEYAGKGEWDLVIKYKHWIPPAKQMILRQLQNFNTGDSWYQTRQRQNADPLEDGPVEWGFENYEPMSYAYKGEDERGIRIRFITSNPHLFPFIRTLILREINRMHTAWGALAIDVIIDPNPVPRFRRVTVGSRTRRL